MFDSAQRNIHYLRLSVTDLCNLRCRYCMPDGVEKLEREAVLTYEEFLRLAALFARCGIDTVRVTGGEPLVRKNVAQLVAGLKATPGIRRVTLTTNAVLLAEQLPALLDAGLDSVNISLDTLRPEVFRQITARDDFAAVQAGLQAALESHGLTVLDRGNLSGPTNPWQPPVDGYRHLPEVVEWNRRVFDAMLAELRLGHLPILMGGDHCLGLGSISAVARHCAEVGKKLRVLWLDAHADFNTSELTPSGNVHGMPVACSALAPPR